MQELRMNTDIAEINTDTGCRMQDARYRIQGKGNKTCIV